MKVQVEIYAYKGAPRFWDLDRPEYYHGWPVYNRAYVCPVCLEVWARMYSAEAPRKGYELQPTPCEQHRPVNECVAAIPGSLLDCGTFCDGTDEDLLKALPTELKLREFELTLKEIERHELASIESSNERTQSFTWSELPP